MKELGEYLKSARIKNGVSLTEVSEDLNLSTALLENIESGNVRAFKDIYELRDNIKKYAKYLGVETDKVNEQFNDFLFEKTSKISASDIKERLKDKNINIEVTENAKTILAREGYDPVYGARPLKRVIRQLVENPLSKKILAQEFTKGDSIKIGLNNDEITFSK